MADRRASIATFASRAEDGRFPRCLFVDAREAEGGVGVDEFWMRRCTTLMYTLWIVIGRLFSIYHKKLSCVLSVLSFPVHFVISEPKHLSHSDFRKMLDYHNGTSKHKVETEGRRVEDSKSLNLKNRCYNSGDPASPDLFPISTIHQGWFRPLPDLPDLVIVASSILERSKWIYLTRSIFRHTPNGHFWTKGWVFDHLMGGHGSRTMG